MKLGWPLTAGTHEVEVKMTDDSLRHPAVLEGQRSERSSQSGVRTVTDAMNAVADEESRGFILYDHELEPETWPYKALVQEARRRGRYLRSLGFKPGARIGLLVPEYSDFVLTFYGLISAGIVPVPMALPFGPRQRGYVETVAAILESSGAEALVMSESLAQIFESISALVPSMREPVFVERMRENQAQQFEEQGPPYEAAPDDLCFLQFTSGSTSKPKGVIVTHGNLVANARVVMTEHFRTDPAVDVQVSWLPLHHDMGLIGFVCFPLITGNTSVLFPTTTFMWRLGSWMQLVHKHRGTITFAPNFAYALVAQRQKNIEQLDLSCLRIVGCGAEPIAAETLRRFASTFAPAGLRPEAMMAAYGMAEHTLATTFESYEEPLRTLRIDRDCYELENLVQPLLDSGERRSLEIVSCGKPFPGHSLGIMAPDGTLLAPGEVGEIVLRGPSCTRGYYGNDAATEALWAHGWLHTGDLGFVYEGNVYVSGRLKDIVIINGKNYYPQDIEWEVELIPGLRRGAVVAFGVEMDGAERVVIVAETKSESAAVALRARVESSVTGIMGLPPGDIVFVAPTVIPKTSSGKVQRRKLRSMYLDGSLLEESRRVREKPTTQVA